MYRAQKTIQGDDCRPRRRSRPRSPPVDEWLCLHVLEVSLCSDRRLEFLDLDGVALFKFAELVIVKSQCA